MSSVESPGKRHACNSSQIEQRIDLDVAGVSEKAGHIDLFAKYSYVGVCEYVVGDSVAHISSAIGPFIAPKATR